MSDAVNKLYKRVQLFSGGGSRFGYYLGSYAALVEHDLRPDIILGTCGGSLAALLVQIAPDPEQLQQLAYSRELYRVIKAIRHVDATEATIKLKLRYSLNAIERWRLSRNSTRHKHYQGKDNHERLIDELQQLAMFRVDNETQWLDELLRFLPSEKSSGNFTSTAPDIAIIASRLRQTVGASSLTNNTAQLQELLFASKRLSLADSHFFKNPLSSPAHAFANGRINQSVKIITEWDIATAVRASMADMYYLPPIHDQDLGWCLGGVINLTPIELACTLADTVFAETKAGYDSWLAAPAIQRIFGFDPNQRLAQVHDFLPPTIHHSENNKQNNSQLHWLPFADNGQQLIGSVRKRFSIKQMTVALIHHDYDGFVQTMQAQWQYGYQRTTDYIQQQQL
ncbi:patatin-like phospholipase family protein [Psychrobacter sp. M13]|uniref:patatin-like phospholipase family protein n=1 Tax=Psychrobacter sp. M13 TaxID=3067275 RepID=UPI00273C2871|nr:patatin-like phospholipase family protein [Psychrobacter sp. M13]WLP95201.1 patatin-like phospholipase family protein [Psychrobacter sp. M13]